MKDQLVRFGVAMESSLVKALDAVAEERGVTRSEILRDLARAEIAKTRVERGAPAAGALTLVYDHHVRELTEHLTEEQHKLGERVRATMHVHLDANHCLEVVVLRGRSDELQKAAERLLATRGVEQGGLQLVAEKPGTHTHSYTHAHDDAHDPHRDPTPGPAHSHDRSRDHAPAHGHAPSHTHAHAHATKKRR